MDTRFESDKALYRVEAEVIRAISLGHGCPIVGYEVRQDRCRRSDVRPWLRLRRQPGGEIVEDGAVSADAHIYGTYIHGLFDDVRFCRNLVGTLRQHRGLAALTEEAWCSQRQFWLGRSEHLADWLAENCNMLPVASALGLIDAGHP